MIDFGLIDADANWCPDCGLPRGVCNCEDHPIDPQMQFLRQSMIDHMVQPFDDDMDAMENDPEWAYEDYFDAPMHDLYPLELDPPGYDNREYDPEDFYEPPVDEGDTRRMRPLFEEDVTNDVQD